MVDERGKGKNISWTLQMKLNLPSLQAQRSIVIESQQNVDDRLVKKQ